MLLMIASNRSSGKAARFSSANSRAGSLEPAWKWIAPQQACVARHVDVAAVLLQHAGGGPIDVAEHGVADAAGEQARPSRGAGRWRAETPAAGLRCARGGGSMSTIRRRLRGQQPREPRRLQELQDAESLGDSRGHERAAELVAVGKQAEQDAAVEPIVVLGAHRQPPAASTSPRETARSACRIARRRGRPFRRRGNRGTARGGRATRGVEFQPAVGHAAHQIDAAARAVVLVARFDVRRAGRRAQSAMDAVEQQLVVEGRAGIGGRRRWSSDCLPRGTEVTEMH